jgi:hypothetical protein
MKPRLHLFGTNGECSHVNFKAFKKKYNITSASIQVLFVAPSEEFFSGAKKMRNKN